MKKLLAIFLSLVVLNAFAETVHILHINGINTSIDEASQNLVELSRSVPINSSIIDWNYIYNPTNTESSSLLNSLWDTMGQKSREKQAAVTIDDYVNTYMLVHGLHYPPDSPEYNALKSQMSPDYESAFTAAAGDNFSTLMTYFMKVFPPPAPNDYTNSGDIFLLIPHSQGNLYANAMFLALTSTYHMQKDRIAIYGIASPAITNQGDQIANSLVQQGVTNVTSYTTSSNDFVMLGLKVLYSSLPANINIPYSSSDPLGHNLISTYLSNPDSLEQISAMIDIDAYLLTGYFSGNLFFPQSKYYKFTVQLPPNQISSFLIGPSNSLLCYSGTCNQDFDYYKLQPHPKQSGIEGYPKIFLLPNKKFIPGTYIAAIGKGAVRDETMRVIFSASFIDTLTAVNNPSLKCTSVQRASFNMIAHLELPWDQLQINCPEYFKNGMFIADQAELN